MKTTFTISFFLTLFGAFAQDPAIAWQKTIGGDQADVLNSFEPTPDGGYILAGYTSSSASGEKTENSNGALDIWLVKVDDTGNIQWQNTIGGSGDDFVNVVKPTADGGYIVLAGSDSNISGDKTENSRGGLDFWILKLNASGDIIWQKTYGGSNPDFDTYGQQTTDGGFLVAGYSDSGATGDKTEASNGQRDYWILKLDANGNIVWQNAMGGSLIDRVQAAAQTPDGGYIIAGFSSSPLSGDKTEANYGGTDYWIVKLNATGSIVWQNTIGGNASDALRDLIPTSDGGYLAGGYSLSSISGEKTENSNGDYDYWLVKLNASGAIEWQNTIGGSGTDYLRDIKQLPDNSYVVAGYSNSNASGDKTEASNGGYDFWLVRIDASGNVTSQNSIGGDADESGPYILPLPGGDFMMACASASGISDDKTEATRGLEDYWLFRTSGAILSTPANRLTDIRLFPNPMKTDFTISLDRPYHNIQLKVTNLSGQIIHRARYEGMSALTVALNAPSGIYMISVDADGGSAHFKLVKE